LNNETENIEESGEIQYPLVSIVGLPNVGKSTLFNRLIGQRRAIVHKTPGVTRDTNVAETDWNGIHFFIADTGGLMPPDGGELEKEVEDQVRQAIADSDLILFLVDGRSGVSPVDYDIADILRKEDCRVLLVANKVEKAVDQSSYHAHNALGLGEPFPISAMRGVNCGDLLDEIVKLLPDQSVHEDSEPESIRIAIVGRPNAGKSSLINRILGEDRLVVFHEGGTTRDSIDTNIEYRDQRMVLIDTAGLRRKSKITDDLEYYSNVRVIRSIERADVVVLLVDSVEGIVRQDTSILSLIEDRGKGMVLSLSKWDLNETLKEEYRDEIREEIPQFAHVPITFTSAVTGEGVWTTLDEALSVGALWKKRTPTPLLNQLLRKAVDRRSPPSSGKKPLRLFYISQVGTSPPTFVLFTSSLRGVKSSYQRYLANFFRDKLELNGVPIRIMYRERKRGLSVRD
jgi:GTP-binding protein